MDFGYWSSERGVIKGNILYSENNLEIALQPVP